MFRDLDTGLLRSNIRISFRSYVSLTVLVSMTACVATLVVVPLILHLAFSLGVFPSILFGIGSALLSGAATTISFYAYPLYRADSLRRNLNDNMSFATSYLAMLASVGVPPDRMFDSLSKVPQDLAVIEESKGIVRDVELFGMDTATALGNAAQRTPSKEFKELLEGFTGTLQTGGDLMAYLMHRSRRSMKSKLMTLRKFSDTLSIFSEFYVTLLIAGPLIFVVMLAVMAMLGGGFGLGMLNPVLLMTLLTYIVIPVGSAVFIVILDALTPRW
jgi:flagellar protein FlaJ